MAVATAIGFPDDDERPHADGDASGEGRGDSGEQSMADPVTRHAPVTSHLRDFRYLICGIDTLDIGIYVRWPEYDDLIQRLIVQRQDAQQSTTPIAWDSWKFGAALVYARGKPPMYPFHVLTAEGHLYFQAQPEPKGSPNLYVSLPSRLLWECGIDTMVERVTARIEALGGEVLRILPSRIDLAADFEIPDGIALDFIREHKVCRSRAMVPYMSDDCLESCYIGKRRAPLQCRIYDKSLEIAVNRSEKAWFFDVWQVFPSTKVWRVEFQVRRPVLKEFGIESMEDLKASLGALWTYLTDVWLSFRLPDDSNTGRRTVHPWWVSIQGCGRLLGPLSNITRDFSRSTTASAAWYVDRMAGLLPGFAAASGQLDFVDALNNLLEEVHAVWGSRNWEQAVERKRLERGTGGDEDGEVGDVPF